jgi:predicted glycoside hydrolase/deacetylase ChbG (UPF0249 family)
MTRYLIVNADDFNLTLGVSRGILRAHREGIVTSTTVLVNLPSLEASRDLARDASGLSLGLHLNLTLGAPVLPAPRVPSLVDSAGRFPRRPARFARQGTSREIRDELAAQVDRFVTAFGRPPSHLDSHHHIHRYPPILEVLADLASSLRIPLRPPSPKSAIALRARGIPAVDRTAGDVGEEALLDARALTALLVALPGGITELMCHPGYHDTDLAVSSYDREREQELCALCDATVREAIAREGIRRIGYRDLPGALEARS